MVAKPFQNQFLNPKSLPLKGGRLNDPYWHSVSENILIHLWAHFASSKLPAILIHPWVFNVGLTTIKSSPPEIKYQQSFWNGKTIHYGQKPARLSNCLDQSLAFLFHQKKQNTENYPLFWWTLIGGLHQCPELLQWQTTSRSKERSAGSSTGTLEATINNHDQLRKESNTPESNGLLINMTVIIIKMIVLFFLFNGIKSTIPSIVWINYSPLKYIFHFFYILKSISLFWVEYGGIDSLSEDHSW